MAMLTIKNTKLKKPSQSENNILILYAPKSACIERADTLTIDTELILDLPKNSTAHLVTQFQGQKNKNNCWTKNRKIVVNTTERILF